MRTTGLQISNKLKRTALLLAAACVLAPAISMTSHAGSSRVTVDKSSFKKEINNAVWNNPEGDVLSKNGKLVFPNGSTKHTRLITKSAIKQNKLTAMMFETKLSMKAVKLPKGQEFVFACGLSGIESRIGEKGNVELVLTNANGLQAALRVYEEAGQAKILAKPVKIRVSENQEFTVDVSLSSEQKYTVKINGKTIYKGELLLTGEGRVGFLQTGKCHVEISNLNIFTYSYDTPENVDIEESFDEGTFDTSKMTSYMIQPCGYYPCSVQVAQYEGDELLMFQNAGLAYIGTKYQYSNFELSFDVPYLQREAIMTKDGATDTPQSQWFGITYGDEYIESATYDYDYLSPELVYFTPGSRINSLKMFKRELADLSNTRLAFFDEDETRGFSVRFTLVDAHVTIGMKWIDEKKFTTVASYDLPDGITPTGYIHIWGSEPSNFGIDNIVLKNKDNDAKSVMTEYQSGKIEVPEDYAYEEMEMTYAAGTAGAEQGFQWYLLIPCAAVVAAVCVIVPLVIVKGRAGKERQDDEK